MAKIKVCGSEYTPGEDAIVYAQVLDDAGMPVNTATVTANLFEEDGSKYLDSVPMTYIEGSNGLYRTETFTAPLEVQRMIVDVRSESPEAYSAEECVVTVAGASIEAIKGLGFESAEDALRIIRQLVEAGGRRGASFDV